MFGAGYVKEGTPCNLSVPKTMKTALARRIVVDVTAWYWHFMAILWLYIFALLKFAA